MIERCIWAVAGIASTFVGLLGLVIPIIPGILFLLLAAVCFSRAANPATKRSSAFSQQEKPSFADALRADLHQQYRRAAQQIARQQRRWKQR